MCGRASIGGRTKARRRAFVVSSREQEREGLEAPARRSKEVYGAVGRDLWCRRVWPNRICVKMHETPATRGRRASEVRMVVLGTIASSRGEQTRQCNRREGAARTGRRIRALARRNGRRQKSRRGRVRRRQGRGPEELFVERALGHHTLVNARGLLGHPGRLVRLNAVSVVGGGGGGGALGRNGAHGRLRPEGGALVKTRRRHRRRRAFPGRAEECMSLVADRCDRWGGRR